jgi:zinc transporter 1/2/3
MSIFAVFIVELVSHRWGASYLRRRGLKLHDIHSASAGAPVLMHTTHGLHVDGTPPASLGGAIDRKQSTDEEAHLSPSHADKDNTNDFSETAVAEIVGVGILEFGVIFHSMIIGLTLAVTDGFVILFIVIVFHRKFDRFSSLYPTT